MWLREKCANVKWRENAKNLTEPYNGQFENLTEPYSKENKALQNLKQHLCGLPSCGHPGFNISKADLLFSINGQFPLK